MSDKLTYIITGLGVFIAFQQYRTTERTRRDRFFERRIEFYDRLKTIIESDDFKFPKDINENKIGKELRILYEESIFLFDEEISNFLKEIYSYHLELINFELVGAEPKAVEDAYFKFEDLVYKNCNFQKIFASYLKIENTWSKEFYDIIKPIIYGFKRLYFALMAINKKSISRIFTEPIKSANISPDKRRN